jgi:peptide/nickel transport system substrate-binding protein
LALDNVGVFTPGTPSASTVGLEPLQGPRSVERARQLLREAGYTNQLVRLLVGSDLASVKALGEVAGDVLRRVGVNLDLVMADWGTVVQRRASQEPLDRGGWSVFCTHSSWFEFSDPAVSGQLRGNGRAASVGWPTSPELEALRETWFDAPYAAARRRVTEQIQSVAMTKLPFIPLGGIHFVTAHRRNLVDRVVALPLFWNIRRA